MRYPFFLILFVLSLTLVSLAQSVPEEEAGAGSLRVSSSRLEADEATRTVAFYGDVRAHKDEMVIYADQMTLFYSDGESKEIDRVEIDGRLRIVQGERVATADRGIFYHQDGRVLLSGNAEVHQGGNQVAGDEIVYYLNESRSVVTSEPDSRVNAVFSPKGTQ
ncbi:MAG: lipopolysaccharide transport periplasmic protein LptA [Desulfuromonas sp.]|nr:MAG: lipopolysaccharide transport periplasmic protein LptA [Desulfuromonas sp.]